MSDTTSMPADLAAPTAPTTPLARTPAELPGPPRLYRNTRRGIIAGVGAGLGEYFGVRPTYVRMVLAIVTGLGAIGLLLYIGMWMAVPARQAHQRAPERAHKVVLTSLEAQAHERRNGIYLVVATIVLALLAASALAINVLAVIVPLTVVTVGAVLVWREFDRSEAMDVDSAESGMFALSRDSFALARIVAGGALVVVGLTYAVIREVNFAQFSSAFIVLVVAIGGIALLTVPVWMRMARTVESERAARIREMERANIASHLHDSVLQTLALIQKRASDPAQVTTLARRQERELRQWLFAVGERSRNDPTSVAAAIERIAEDIEDTFELQVSQVVVGGDAPLGDNEQAAIAAARECLVNVAKHAGVDRADVFCEVLSTDDVPCLELFIRDRGRGFDPDAVPADRRGLALSVHQRIESRGGSVRVRSKIGSGTEVAIRIPVSAAPASGAAGSR